MLSKLSCIPTLLTHVFRCTLQVTLLWESCRQCRIKPLNLPSTSRGSTSFPQRGCTPGLNTNSSLSTRCCTGEPKNNGKRSAVALLLIPPSTTSWLTNLNLNLMNPITPISRPAWKWWMGPSPLLYIPIEEVGSNLKYLLLPIKSCVLEAEHYSPFTTYLCLHMIWCSALTTPPHFIGWACSHQIIVVSPLYIYVHRSLYRHFFIYTFYTNTI